MLLATARPFWVPVFRRNFAVSRYRQHSKCELGIKGQYPLKQALAELVFCGGPGIWEAAARAAQCPEVGFQLIFMTEVEVRDSSKASQISVHSQIIIKEEQSGFVTGGQHLPPNRHVFCSIRMF